MKKYPKIKRLGDSSNAGILEEGEDISMDLMEDLWRRVFDDIIEEKYEEIFVGNHIIDTKDFRSAVASNCADVLQRYLNRPENSALNELKT